MRNASATEKRAASRRRASGASRRVSAALPPGVIPIQRSSPEDAHCAFPYRRTLCRGRSFAAPAAGGAAAEVSGKFYKFSLKKSHKPAVAGQQSAFLTPPDVSRAVSDGKRGLAFADL